MCNIHIYFVYIGNEIGAEMEDNEYWGKEYTKLADLYAIKCKQVRELEEKNRQIKAEVIEETLNKVTKRMSDYLEFDDVKIDWDLFCDEIKEIAEQLKE
ncbi:MAG: hypothetical protein KBT27_02640 [Prevotellaceae bacterium]|nr:hypothetical protein [Candidatus Faecinaster equi]